MNWFKDLKRGSLIEFECFFDGKVRFSHRSIYHGDGMAHVFNRRDCGLMLCGRPMVGDAVSRTRRGIKVFRNLDTSDGPLMEEIFPEVDVRSEIAKEHGILTRRKNKPRKASHEVERKWNVV